MFPRDTYVSRRSILTANFDSGILLLPGNGESPMNYADNPYHFRQDSTFLYYIGLDQADLAATYSSESFFSNCSNSSRRTASATGASAGASASASTAASYS